MTVYRHFQQKDKICTMIKHYICAKAFSLNNFVACNLWHTHKQIYGIKEKQIANQFNFRSSKPTLTFIKNIFHAPFKMVGQIFRFPFHSAVSQCPL